MLGGLKQDRLDFGLECLETPNIDGIAEVVLEVLPMLQHEPNYLVQDVEHFGVVLLRHKHHVHLWPWPLVLAAHYN